MDTIHEIIDAFAAKQREWRGDHDRAIVARAVMLAVYQHAVHAAVCARNAGLALDVRETSGDGIELVFRGRSARFRRGTSGAVWVHVVESDGATSADRRPTMPESVGGADDWAGEQVSEALSVLMAT